jgi:hypothetical protein
MAASREGIVTVPTRKSSIISDGSKSSKADESLCSKRSGQSVGGGSTSSKKSRILQGSDADLDDIQRDCLDSVSLNVMEQYMALRRKQEPAKYKFSDLDSDVVSHTLKLVGAVARFELQYSSFEPSKELMTRLRLLPFIWDISSEAGKRILIDQMLLEVLQRGLHAGSKCMTQKQIEAAERSKLMVSCEFNVGNKVELLTGRIDYVCGLKMGAVVKLPIFVVVEAKQALAESGQWQLIGELYAVWQLNKDQKPVYGVLSDGITWEFFKLEQNSQLPDNVTAIWSKSVRYDYLKDTPVILGFIHKVLNDGARASC